MCGIRVLRNIWRAMDVKGDGIVALDDFRWGLIDYGLNVSKEDAENVAKALHPGAWHHQVDTNAFMALLQTGERTTDEVIEKAYKKLEEAGEGKVTLDCIAKHLDGAALPDVHAGRKPEADAYMEFMSLFDTQIKDGVVSPAEFKDYMNSIASLIDSDEAFTAVMTAAWKLE